MRRKASAVAMLTETCQDARLGKNRPGRNARFAGKEQMNAAKNHVIRQRSSVLRKRRRRRITRAEVMPLPDPTPYDPRPGSSWLLI